MNTEGAKPPDRLSAAEQGKEGASSKPSYATILKKERGPYQRMDLTYIEPNKVNGKPLVELPASIVRVGAEKWQHTVIGYVLGYNPNFQEMQNYVRVRWNEVGNVKIHRMGRGIYVFQMESEDKKQEILEKGPWSFSRKPFILRNWEIGMPLDKPDVEKLPIWVQFPHLPLDLWTAEALSLVASQVGKPLFADRTTSEQSRLAYARVCIEVNAKDELLEEIPVRYWTGHEYEQKVVYEWKPSRCSRCEKFGHDDEGCSIRKMQEQKETKAESSRKNEVKNSSVAERMEKADSQNISPKKEEPSRKHTPMGMEKMEEKDRKNLSPIGEIEEVELTTPVECKGEEKTTNKETYAAIVTNTNEVAGKGKQKKKNIKAQGKGSGNRYTVLNHVK